MLKAAEKVQEAQQGCSFIVHNPPVVFHQDTRVSFHPKARSDAELTITHASGLRKVRPLVTSIGIA